MIKSIANTGLAGAILLTSMSAVAYNCNSLPEWDSGVVYTGGQEVQQNNIAYRANWWTRGNSPSAYSAQYQEWSNLGSCEGSTTPPPANQAPSISLTYPASGSTFTEGESITLVASANDSDGSISKVSFYAGNLLLGEDSRSPYSMDWTTTVGSYQLKAVALDNDNASTDSATTAISVTGAIAGGDSDCRPDGLYHTPGVNTPYCTVYDENGREKMGADHPRRIIGYFTSWRNGANGQPSYLVSNIPWDKLTHINYAFAHVDSDNKISIGDPANPNNPATGMEWSGVAGAEMSSNYVYKGHFNLLNKYKEQYPDVKTLISVGGWAETGGYFDESGSRVASGGFYTMTTNSDGSVNQAGINTFADSVVQFLRDYGFDGADIDYEYPTSMSNAGHPLDFPIADNLRGGLMNSYVVLMKTLREKLDAAGEQDGKHYLLTIASPSSGWLLRGMDTFQVTRYLDYVNIMSYDLHGAWNEYVGHNAALFDAGNDAELAASGVYGSAQYGGIGYLNTDWAVKYFRGAMQAGRINIGIPYYTRGWQGVTNGTNGLNGLAPLPGQSDCPGGTGGSAKCGYGATGIDNMWHDKDEYGREIGSGTNPLWHAKNLENNIQGSYLTSWGLDPASNSDHQLTGSYQRFYDSVSVAPWLWNDSKKVFLSIEDEESMGTKLQYVIDNGIGGIMFWELAGDYGRDAGNGEYTVGTTLTSLAYDRFSTADPYDNRRTDRTLPAEAVDIKVEVSGFKLGDQNYPLNPSLIITNNTGIDLPGGSEFRFDMPVSTSDTITDQSGYNMTVVESGANAAGNNIGGLENDFHRLSLVLPGWQNLADGDSAKITLNYYLPITGPQAWVVTINGMDYALHSEYPELPLADLGSGGGNSGQGGQGCDDAGISTSGLVTYPDWPNGGSNANGGERIMHNGSVYEAKWWTNTEPGSDDTWTFVCTI